MSALSPEQVFAVANGVALASWVTLAVFPKRAWAGELLAGRVVPMMLAVLYAGIIAAMFPGAEGGFSSLDAVASLFRQPWLLLAGWVHYLAFDLLIGTWEARDAREHRVPHLLLLPCLAMTFLFGPAGWLLYLLARTWLMRARSLPSGSSKNAIHSSTPES